MSDNTSGGVLTALSSELAAAVQRAAQHVVSVDARRQGAASGIVWPGGGGIIVTADHAVERDEDITVVFPDGKKVGATVAGRDPGSDVAVLRLASTEGAPAPAELAPADSVKVGHLVLAVGRPGEGVPMASFGIVSATGGTWRTARGGIVQGYIRADVTLYPGFSGGPLVDAQGRVAGLNSWHLANGQEIAIPSQTVSGIVQTILTHGKVRRGYLGVTSQPVAIPSALQQQANLGQQGTGLVIVGVEAGSPAERGGLIIGDVLVAVGGRPVASAEDLQMALAGNVVGQATPVSVLRGGERKELTVTPGERQ
jgi:S1-C subfamily serine protease